METAELVEPKFKSFFAGLNSSLNSIKEVQKLYDPVMAFGFNAFDFIWDNERKLSEVLAFFLDPKKPHGQGAVFLKLFLERRNDDRGLKLLEKKLYPTVIVEKHTGDGYVDIVLEWGRSYAIGIENKCWNAPDQVKQLDRYSKHLDSITDNCFNYSLLYLTPENREPWDGSLDKETLKILTENSCYENLTFNHFIIPLVKSWAMHCQAHRVQVFLNDFEHYLRKQFLNEQFMNQQDKVIEYALKPENIETAFAVIDVQDKIFEQLYYRFKNEVITFATQWGFKIQEEDEYNTQANQDRVYIDLEYGEKSEFTFIKANWNRVAVNFSFEKTYNQSFYYGVLIIADVKLSKTETDKLREIFGEPFNSTDAWPFWRWHSHKDWNTQTYREILDGSLIKNIETIVGDMIQKLEQSGLEL